MRSTQHPLLGPAHGQVQWQEDVLRRTALTTPHLLALMTTRQLLLMNSDLVVLASISVGSSPVCATGHPGRGRAWCGAEGRAVAGFGVWGERHAGCETQHRWLREATSFLTGAQEGVGHWVMAGQYPLLCTPTTAEEHLLGRKIVGLQYGHGPAVHHDGWDGGGVHLSTPRHCYCWGAA